MLMYTLSSVCVQLGAGHHTSYTHARNVIKMRLIFALNSSSLFHLNIFLCYGALKWSIRDYTNSQSLSGASKIDHTRTWGEEEGVAPCTCPIPQYPQPSPINLQVTLYYHSIPVIPQISPIHFIFTLNYFWIQAYHTNIYHVNYHNFHSSPS